MKTPKEVVSDAVGYFEGAEPERDDKCADYILQRLKAAGFAVVPVEPDTAMKRALLVHRGYDPDAKEETLDRLGNIDIMTMGTYLAAYRAMVLAHLPRTPEAYGIRRCTRRQDRRSGNACRSGRNAGRR